MATGGEDWLLVGHALVMMGRPVTVWLLHLVFLSYRLGKIGCMHRIFCVILIAAVQPALGQICTHRRERLKVCFFYPCAVSFSLSKSTCLRGIYFIEKCF